MKLNEVVSSNIKKIGYEGTDLIVEYKSGVQYRYKDVPQELYEGLSQAESKGRFMNANIKGKFEYERIPILESGKIPDTK